MPRICRKSNYIVGLTAFALILGTAVMAQDESAGQPLHQARAEYNTAIRNQDVDAIVAFFDDDYQITTSLGQLLQGKEDEVDAWNGLFATRDELLYVRTPDTFEVSEDYPLAAETGTWVGRWRSASGPVRTGGRYAAMWRLVDSQWKVRSELFVALYCEGIDCPQL